MKQQIIAIIEKEGFITDLESSYINIQWDMLSIKAYLTIKSGKYEVSSQVSPEFAHECAFLIKDQNKFLIMSSSDILNFKNNLISLINNYFK